MPFWKTLMIWINLVLLPIKIEFTIKSNKQVPNLSLIC